MSAQTVIPQQDLPNWMKQARVGFDWGILIVVGFSLLMAWSFIENPNLPRTNDNIHYAFQANDAATALREGRLYPRWSPYAMGGLGAPVPHYTAPGASYLTAVIDVLFTNDTIFAMRIVYVLSFILAGLAVYRLMMQRVNALAGIIAALLYVYSPYFGLTVPHVLGDLPQVMALALVPLLLWGVNRLLLHHQAALVHVTLASAILFLTSPQHMILGFSLSGVLFIIHISKVGEWRQTLYVGLALLLGFGTAAFYWLPAYYEQNLVQWLPVANYQPQYRLFFSELFLRTQQLDSGVIRHIAIFNLGWALLLFIGISGLLLLFRQGTVFQAIFLVVGIVLALIAEVLLPSETWLMGGVVLCLAIGGSTIGDKLYELRSLLRYILIVMIFAILFWLALPIWLSQSSTRFIDSVSPSDQFQYESDTNNLALLPTHAIYPTTLTRDVFAASESSLEVPFNSRSRFRNTNLAQLSLSELGTHFARYSVFTQAPTTIIYEQAYFLGWRAELDNVAIPLAVDEATGLIQLNLPVASNGSLTIAMETVSIRVAAWIMTYTMLGFAIILAWRRMVASPNIFYKTHLLSIGTVRLLVFLFMIGIASRTLPSLRDALNNLREPTYYGLENRDFTTVYGTDSHLDFVGYRMPDDPIAAGDTISLSLYWRAIRQSDSLYQVSIRIRNIESDTIVYESGNRPPGYYPTSLWASNISDGGNLYMEDRYQIRLPQDVPIGDYVVEVMMWYCTPQCDGVVNFYIRNRQPIGSLLPIPLTIQ
ncbi:MAG: glycosyltransferase family 39 protein [Anaerolineae bacterium]|nr:glycosyltransferase family 39 protein [Anaerolineae bacterium]